MPPIKQSTWLAVLLLVQAIPSTATAAPVPVTARVEGLALGNTLTAQVANQSTVVSLNGQVTLGTQEPGSALSIAISAQPRGQLCAVSDMAPNQVPADSAPVFIRCRHIPAPRLVMPTTTPDDALAFWLDGVGLRAVAHPGLPYESRPGVRGGLFPYEFRLLSVQSPGNSLALSQVALDFRRGTLRFTPVMPGTYRFQIEVRDSSATQRSLQREFVIVADADSFRFVASDGVDAIGRGGLAQPYRTIGFAMLQSTENQVLMLRKGRYAERIIVRDDTARQVLAYPDEVVEIDLAGLGDISLRFDTPPTARLEGLDILNATQYAIVSDPTRPGAVLRLLQFRDAVVANSGENPAFVHGWGDGSPDTRHRFLVQDSDFGSYPNGYATTWFDAGDSIVENNQIRLGASTSGLHDKDNAQRNVYRENYIEYATAFRNNNGVQVSAQSNSERVHIHHNLFVNSGILLGGQCLLPECYMREHDVHHNTMISSEIVLRWGVFNSASRDTRVYQNLIQTTRSPFAWASCLNTVPPNFVPQLRSGANRFETSSANAMRDTECGGSVMNMSWSTWNGQFGLDTVISGSVLSSTSDLIGAGPTSQLPPGDSRATELGHRYPLAGAIAVSLFADGYE